MKTTKIEICPITHEQISDVIITDNYFEYSLEYVGKKYILRFAIIEEWNPTEDIKEEDRNVLLAMLYNNEWPIESETLLSPNLISQIMRLGEYPRSFDDKVNSYLLKCYLNGGKEYKPVGFDITRRLETFAFDDNEFGRIFKALQSKEFIKLPTPRSVLNKYAHQKLDLTEKGRQFAKSLIDAKLAESPQWSANTPKPRITVISVKEDSFSLEKLKKLLSEYGIGVVSYNGLEDNHGSATVSNIKNGLYSSENNYVIFIKSVESDTSSSYGSVLDIAIEAHENTTAKAKFKYIYVAFIDDSQTKTRPRIENYYSSFYDFRIITNRKRLVLDIQKDWNKRLAMNNENSSQTVRENIKEYNFRKIILKEGEAYWLKLLYDYFIKDKETSYSNFISQHWDFLPKGFNPNNVNSLLHIAGCNITLYGIWSIDPQSKYIKVVEDIILAIKGILKEKGKPNTITGDLLLPKLNHQPSDVSKSLILLNRLGGFFNWSDGNPDGTSIKIKIERDEELNEYKNFNSLEDLFEKRYPDSLKNNNLSDTKDSEKNISELLNKQIDLENIHSHRTKFVYRDKGDIKPVMGVTELSVDLAEIIDTLPIDKEKGQMIGIFGKWGRGKTFLLNEIWNILEKKTETKYIKLEFHAWKYQETPASWAYLYEIFVTEFLGSKKNLQYYKKLIALNYIRLGAWPIIKFFLALFVAIITPFASVYFLKWYSFIIIPIIGIGFIGFLKYLYKEFSTKAIDLVKKYSIRHSFKETLGIQADIQGELIKLLKVWILKSDFGKKKILLVVEDIDRCTEERIIQNIDALRIMLEDDEISKRVIIITAIDERILKNAIKLKYKSILSDDYNDAHEGESSDTVNIHKFISEYLDKLFISAIKLGGLTSDQRSEYLNELLTQEVGEETLKNIHSNIEKEKIVSGFPPILTEALKNDEHFMNMHYTNQLIDKISLQTGIEDSDMIIENGDFLIHEGDLAIKNSKGKVTSMPEMETIFQNRISNQDKFEKLSTDEILLIKEVISIWTSATPRRIRIFYYRYLLSKNLLINKYIRLKSINVWQDKKGIKAMMFLILEYTKKHDPEFISQAKLNLLSKTDDRITLSINDGKISITPYKLDYLYLLEVLELVIAY